MQKVWGKLKKSYLTSVYRFVPSSLAGQYDNKPRKATITRRGGALGHVSYQQDEGSNEESNSLEHLRSHLVVAMGGRAAEAIFSGEEKVTTGASSDMQQAYRIAKSIGSHTPFLQL